MPRILIVRTEGSPFGTRLARVMRTIRETGWNCHVICAEGSVSQGTVDGSILDLREQITIYEFPVPDGLGSRLYRWITGAGYLGSRHFRKCLKARLAENAYDAIMVKDSPILHSVFKVLDRNREKDPPVVCEMVEPRVAQAHDSLFRYGTWVAKIGGYFRRIVPRLRAVERECLPRCDRIFTVVDEMKTWLTNTYELDPNRISVVQNTPVLSELDAIQEPGVPPKMSQRVSFVGSFGPHRGLESLIDAAALVRQQQPACPDFQLAIVGGSPAQVRRLESLCADRGISDITELVPKVSHRLAIQWMKESDIGVIPHVDTLGIRTTVPFKLFDYMAVGAACLVSDVGPLGRIIRKTNAGLVFQPGSVADLAEKLGCLLGDKQNTSAMGRRGRWHAERGLCWEIESEKYSQYLASITSATDS